MIKNTRHTGLVVRDLEKSLKFYEVLGFKLWKREIETGDFISTVVGIMEVSVETAKLKAVDNSMLEILQYHSHPQSKDFSNAPSNQLGCSHIAFTVDNIMNVCKLIQEMGGSVVNQPVLAPSGKVKVAYCHDIDGILMELVEEI
jgi:catechol 2,3-dioxygenase-like lactoylglutathione lyase family enzyme